MICFDASGTLLMMPRSCAAYLMLLPMLMLIAPPITIDVILSDTITRCFAHRHAALRLRRLFSQRRHALKAATSHGAASVYAIRCAAAAMLIFMMIITPCV